MSTTANANPHDRLQRLGRLTLKELREILRDRRTIVTLVLMPLLMYPLLTVVFQQFFLTHLGNVQAPRYRIAFRSAQEGHYLADILAAGGLRLFDADSDGPPPREDVDSQPIVVAGVTPNLEDALSDFEIDVGIRLNAREGDYLDPQKDLAVDAELLVRDDVLRSQQAATLLEKHFRQASERFLKSRLGRLQVTQRPVPIQVERRHITVAESASGTVSIAAVIPFILIMMTVTGAVYPAIDLTAGERERGTLEVLVAAPIPRIGVLFAKYIAVLTVALLTAAANLLTMTITITASGLGQLLFGETGLSPGAVAAVFGLLLLFAAFFSALLLAITSSARSFKEAQAYLIPLMLVSLAPGLLSLMPGRELGGLWLVTPLANIVLLGRDLLKLQASGIAAVTVVASTLLYAGVAIALAARIFGAESVLYSSESGWSDVLRRPREPQPAPTLTSAALCLSLMFPAYFLLINLMSRRYASPGEQLLNGMLMTAFVFGAIPGAACWFRRVAMAPAFRVPRAAPLVFSGTVLLGFSLWTLDHELVMLTQKLRGVTISHEFLKLVSEYAAKLRTLPVEYVVLALAIVPAVFEEAFFRGYFFAALRTVGSATVAIVVSGLTFGFFHYIAPNPIAVDRFLATTAMGLLLGWVRWRTDSVLPGMLLHACHNGLIALILHYEPQLSALGLGDSRQSHLPAPWLAAGAVGTVLGLTTLWFAGRRQAEET